MNNQTKFPEVVVVEASAGSGKTFTLAKRYLQLLINSYLELSDIPLKNILAITFTNKATVEMKERILELLKKISLDAFINKEEENDILTTLGVDKKFAQSKANFIMDEFIKHYNFFQVQTIDSFINALLLGCALNIERSASFKIKRDYSKQLAYCLDLVIEKAVTDKDVFTFLEDFLEHYLFVENRSGWFPKDDILQLMQSLFRLSNKYGRLFQTYKGSSKEVISKKKYIYQQINKLSSHFPQGLNANTQRSILAFIEKSKDIFDIANLPSGLKSMEVAMNKGNAAPADFKKEWKRIHKEILELVELDATVVYNPYIKLFHSLIDFFQIVSKKEDVLFLEELNKKARLLFDEEGLTVAEVYYRFATRFKHYLIDEFQDTSVLQWRNLETMVEDALASGGSLFYVGDKKQAIYRFRGGEAKLFDEVRREFSRYNVIPTHLIDNWRSQKAIIDFNNIIFSKDNLLRAFALSGINVELGESNIAQDEIIDIFKDAKQQGRPENCYGYVRIEFIDDKNQEERNSAIQPKLLNLIKELRKRFSYEDIAILARDNAEVELISSWLLFDKIPVESEKTLNVIENYLIKEVISFFRFLNSPIDDLNFCAFILGEIFFRASKISNREITEFIFSLHKERKLSNTISLYHLFRNKYPQIWEKYFEEFFKSVGFISPYELLVGIYNSFGVLEYFKDQQAFFMKFLELVKEKEEDYVGMGEFLDYLGGASSDDLYVNATHSDSVKVLTIHKSKGLEFPVVIIPFLRMDISPETAGKGTNSYVTVDVNDNLGLVRITKTHREYSQILQEIYAEDYKKACIDELNNIYVALTRPKYELYIFLPKKSAGANNKALFLIPKGIKEQGKQMQYQNSKQAVTQPLINISPSVYKDWIKSLGSEFANAANFIHKEKILEGNIMHTMLSQISNCLNCDIKELIECALRFTQDHYPFIEDLHLHEEKTLKLIEKKELKDIFYISDGKVFCEKEIVNSFGDLKRIDRLIVREKEIWIIDYKSSQESKLEQIKQVLEYIGIMKEIYPQKEIKGFLVYLDEMKLEQVKD
ncbi:MAG: UvrD-helicase domain-containing protein [Candidatus Omnitrophota bacterium]|nr:UvrD-helicase domain-containing protein [Candidatus Omnitrophota bacterium]